MVLSKKVFPGFSSSALTKNGRSGSTQNQSGRRIKNTTYREHSENPPDTQIHPEKPENIGNSTEEICSFCMDYLPDERFAETVF